MKRSILVAVVALVAAACVAAPAWAATTYYVSPSGDDASPGTSATAAFRTLQKALDVAPTGSTIRLAPGTYLQDAVTTRPGIRITGPASAVLQGAGGSRVVQVRHDDVTLDGFTIDGLFGSPDSKDGYRDKLIYAMSPVAGDGVAGLTIRGMTLTNAGGECVRLRYLLTGAQVSGNRIGPCGVHDFVFHDGGKNGEAIYIGTAPEQQGLNGAPDARPDVSRDNRVWGNLIDTRGNECVDIKENSTANVVEANVCTGQQDPESAGFDARGSGNTFRYNVARDNLGAGIRFGGDTPADGTRNDAYGNVITGNARGGIKSKPRRRAGCAATRCRTTPAGTPSARTRASSLRPPRVRVDRVVPHSFHTFRPRTEPQLEPTFATFRNRPNTVLSRCYSSILSAKWGASRHIPWGVGMDNRRPWRAQITRIAVIGCALIAPALAVPVASATGDGRDGAPKVAAKDRWSVVDNSGKTASAAAFATLRTKAQRNGAVRVIVGLRTKHTAEGALSATQATAQHKAIAGKAGELTSALKGSTYRVVRTFQTVPYVALELDAAALDRLRASGQAASLQEDSLDRLDLAQSSPLVEATESWAVGRTGAGQNVAILDTGVEKGHSFLQRAAGGTKVVSEACFSANATCPGGVTSSTAVNSGLPCVTATSDCRHGTHVAGIAAGRGASFSGVAKEANLLSIRVFSVFTDSASCGGAPPCALSFVSDQIAGLERVFALRNTFAIAAANMSLGSVATTAANCDADSRKAAIDNLRSVGIATVISSGNSSSNTGVSTPACISTSITVGATSKTDVVAGFSNSSPLVELLAPGVSINSSVPGNAFALFNGTSMAAPHVAGAWALLNQVNNAVTVPTALSALQSTGRPVTDADNGVVKPRIKVLAAGTRIGDSGLRVALTSTAPNLDLASDGVGMAHRLGAPASASFSIAGIPSGATVQFARLVWTTIGGPDPSVVFRGAAVNGALIAASADTCWNLNNLQPNRTYLASVAVPGNGTYTLSGVGGVSGADGQGASLIVAYRTATGTIGRVYARFGADSAVQAGTSAGTTLSTSGNGVHLRRPALHVGVGDGQSATEDPLLFSGSAVTSPNFFGASQGQMWDDDRIPVSTSLIPAGSAGRPLSVTVGSECLVLSYAAATWQTSG